MVQSPQIPVNSPQPQNVTSPIQQQPQNINSPRLVSTATTTPPNITSPPLPTSTILSQNLISVESKVIQLQQLNKDIYSLIKLITPPQNCNINSSNQNKPSNISSSSSLPHTPTLLSVSSSNLLTSSSSSSTQLNNTNIMDLAEYKKNVQLLNQYKIKVQCLIKEIQLDLNNQNFSLYFISPILNDEHPTQDSLFYEPYYLTSTKSTDTDNLESMQLESSTSETIEQHNNRMFTEKFKRQLTPEVIQNQYQLWDAVTKDREKLNKNSDRVKMSIFK